VFHVALGGGEALELDYLFAVASHARRVGITPNLTTSGLGLDAAAAEKCRVFGQINVSVDGVGAAYAAARGFDGFRHAERALRLLRAVKREVGVNCVVSRSSFPRVPEVARLVRKLRLNELELLRFKPVGRGARLDEELTPAQCRELWPMARRLVWRERIRVKLDCSFAPMVFWHRPSAKAAAFFGVQGCVGGDVLAAVQPEGAFTGCSFTARPAADARIPGAMTEGWRSGFSEFRDYAAHAPEPCASCEYLRLCNGGCRAVGTPDPDARACRSTARACRCRCRRVSDRALLLAHAVLGFGALFAGTHHAAHAVLSALEDRRRGRSGGSAGSLRSR